MWLGAEANYFVFTNYWKHMPLHPKLSEEEEN